MPVLEIGNKIIAESLVTSEYLDEAYPGPKLEPTDPYVKARHNVLIQRFRAKVRLLEKACQGRAALKDKRFRDG